MDSRQENHQIVSQMILFWKGSELWSLNFNSRISSYFSHHLNPESELRLCLSPQILWADRLILDERVCPDPFSGDIYNPTNSVDKKPPTSQNSTSRWPLTRDIAKSIWRRKCFWREWKAGRNVRSSKQNCEEGPVFRPSHPSEYPTFLYHPQFAELAFFFLQCKFQSFGPVLLVWSEKAFNHFLCTCHQPLVGTYLRKTIAVDWSCVSKVFILWVFTEETSIQILSNLKSLYTLVH